MFTDDLWFVGFKTELLLGDLNLWSFYVFTDDLWFVGFKSDLLVDLKLKFCLLLSVKSEFWDFLVSGSITCCLVLWWSTSTTGTSHVNFLRLNSDLLVELKLWSDCLFTDDLVFVDLKF